MGRLKCLEVWLDGWIMFRMFLVEIGCEVGIFFNLVSGKCFGLMEFLYFNLVIIIVIVLG